MKPAVPINRSRPQKHAGFTVHATEPKGNKNYKWTSKTFPDINVRMGTDSQSEHEQPSAHQNEQTCYDYEYVTSSSLEDLRHLKILPAKPMVTQSVYADKRCLPARPPPRSPNNGQPLDHRPQAAFRQQSIVNVQPSTQYKSNNMQRHKKNVDSYTGFGVQGPAVDRTAKPVTTMKTTSQASEKESILDSKQTATPPPRRPPKSIPKEFKELPPEPSHAHSFLRPDNILHSINEPSITQPENDIGLPKGKQNEAITQKNGPAFRRSRDILLPVNKQQSIPFRPISKSLPPESSQHQTSQIPEMIFQDPFTRRKPQASRDLQKPKLLSSPAAKDLEGQIWYFGACDRYKIEEALRLHNKNGTFLVRDSSKGYPDKPYVLVVYYRFKVYSIQIRYLEDTNQYALGSGLRGHDIFDSVPEIINIHKNIPLRLIDRRDQSGSQMEQCTLTFPLILH
ncbi:cytokine-dependent hematopoietic cell linker-like [Chiloscyllium punctatum]|uniref:cytokine-dependent hematopoietic cell linker-like n=1 Tax=Chiloscyllium punctatum TaxID=137246 RepID=UPI003B63CB08